MQYQGVVSTISSFDYMGNALWSFQLNGDRSYYRTGKIKPKVEKGNYITFTAEPGKNGSINVDTKSIQTKLVEAEASGVSTLKATPPASGSNSNQGYWEAKTERDIVTQARIERQSTRNSAIEFIKVLISQEALKIPAKNKLEFFEQLLSHYQEEFILDNSGESKEEVVAVPVQPNDGDDYS